MSAHTPGPWCIGTPGPNGCMTIGTEQGLMTAVIAHSVNENDQRETAQANARLIAAAPELLAALVEINSIDCHSILTVEDSDAITERVRAAIAKATGGQS